MNPRRWYWYALFTALALACLVGAVWLVSQLQLDLLP